ncbi:urea ABC transporter permease subunit UrtB [Shimia aestuarii]|uniref:Amino acid/amide ABC transporter membrane protein 1, HAAT family n=1 Tax=Shimia aestuarii TaxID=254406 RepID=A0A1I4J8Q3_9RHOB|nr:urea ABC transporter permease subunit UrtB [Shimia aestuarii]SFL62934.1 amino acid/amide ABC transporter membrane protein 1, HAAT family [Shimia aestuarii]
MRVLLAALAAILFLSPTLQAQPTTVQEVLQAHGDAIAKGSRKSIGPAIDAIAASGLPQAQTVLETWQAKDMWQRKSDGLFFSAKEVAKKTYRLTDFDTGQTVGEFDKGDLRQLKPNSGVRALIGVALVQFQLSDPDPARRLDALTAIQRDPEPSHLAPLRASIDGETDPAIKIRKQQLETLLTIRFDSDDASRIAAIETISKDISLDTRATLNTLLATTRKAAPGAVPETENIAAVLKPGTEQLSAGDAYTLLADNGLAPALITDGEQRNILSANISGGKVSGVPVASLNTQAARDRAYAALVAEGKAVPRPTAEDITAALANHSFYDAYFEPSKPVTDAAAKALKSVEIRVAFNQTLDLALDGISLASIFFLAAIGLAITFGVMGVINMAHGEFIMMGAYTGYVVQQFIPNYTVSILVALPLAFAVTFAAGVAMERLVIRHLYNRPLETLLATFGISIALQQIAKNIFGTQARPLTAPEWLDGAWVLNDVVSISFIRIAIFALALIFLGVFLFIMRRTRLGLETRAVTQNPRMAASMGINPDRVNMLTFGLGSGIAGIAGVAIGLFAKVTSELGSDYIVQSFMTVVVGGVGNIWGTLAGAAMIGFLQKGIEWMNPSNTLAAQTYMIIFIIIFIQFRPRGIIALKGRAAGD